MIKVFKANDNDFTSNGDKIIKPFEAIISKTIEEEYLELEAPLKYAEFLIQDNILIVDTLTGKKGYQIHNPIQGNVIRIKAPLIYQEEQSLPADRGAVISYGKNLENCEVSENWDDVVTKLKPIGYNGVTLPEEFISVPTPHQRVYEKSIEFKLSESLENTVKELEETIEAGASLIVELDTSIMNLNNKITTSTLAIDNLSLEIVAVQNKINNLGTSETELREKTILEQEIIAINNEILALANNKVLYQDTIVQTQVERVAAFNKYNADTLTYNNTIIIDLRTQAQSYLNANIYPHVNYDLQAHLNGVIEIGDTVKIKHDKLNIDMFAYITAYKLDCITLKFTDLQFGTQRITLRSKLTGIEQSIKTVSDGVTGISTLIEQLSNQIVLRVDTATGKVALFKLGSDLNSTDILIKADNVILEGLITANGYFKILPDGSMEAINGKFKGKIFASELIGGSIESENFVPGVSGTKIYLNDGSIQSKQWRINEDGELELTDGELKVTLTSGSMLFDNLLGRLLMGGSHMSMYKKMSEGLQALILNLNMAGETPVMQFNGQGNFKSLYVNNNITCQTINNETPVTTSDLSNLATWVTQNFVSK